MIVESTLMNDWDNNDLSEVERQLLKLAGFYPWGGGHWCAEHDQGETCYDDKWAVEEALTVVGGSNHCANHPERSAMPDDYLCWLCRNS